MDPQKITEFVQEAWAFDGPRRSVIIKALEEFVKIPNETPAIDPNWADRGHTDEALDLLVGALNDLRNAWRGRGLAVDDLTVETVGSADAPEYDENGDRRSPLLLVDVPASGQRPPEGVALFYGHLDKQPGLDGQWSAGLGPRTPVIRDGRLYGRGTGDDGYALFSALSAIMAVRALGADHSRCLIMIEAGEESGSPDLEHYLRKLRERLGEVRLIVGLDGGAVNYDQLWSTASLRGLVDGRLKVATLQAGAHSGDVSGVVPSGFRILRRLLSRLEDPDTGEIFPDELKVDIPDQAKREAKSVAALLKNGFSEKFPLLDGVRPVTDDPEALLLNRGWRTQLTVIGFDGLPPTRGAGNVMWPEVRAGLSFRLPPTLDSGRAARFIRETLEKNPPYQAKVEFTVNEYADGWAAPQAEKLAGDLDEASRLFFGRKTMALAEGGSIPLMGLLQAMFPEAAFLITGVLGPQANPHGPDEFLHLPTVQRVTMAVAWVLGKFGNV